MVGPLAGAPAGAVGVCLADPSRAREVQDDLAAIALKVRSPLYEPYLGHYLMRPSPSRCEALSRPLYEHYLGPYMSLI